MPAPTPAPTAPTPAPTAPTLADDLMLAVTRLARLLRRVADDGISPTQRAVLATIERAGPITLGDLAAVERVQPPTITAAVGKLEQDGLVVREQDPKDRRVVRVRLTPAGRKLLERARSRRTAYLERRLRALSEDEQARVAEAAAILRDLFEDAP